LALTSAVTAKGSPLCIILFSISSSSPPSALCLFSLSFAFIFFLALHQRVGFELCDYYATRPADDASEKLLWRFSMPPASQIMQIGSGGLCFNLPPPPLPFDADDEN
jgi:hypothetical protein